MPLPTPILDDRSYQQLRDELVRRIPVYNPEWTDHNPSDPGITLLELFAFLGENLLYRFNQIPESTKLAFLQLLQIPLRPATSARALLSIENAQPADPAQDPPRADVGAEAKAGNISFESLTEATVAPWRFVAVARKRVEKPDPATDPEAVAYAAASIDAVGGLKEGEEAAFYKNDLVPDDPAKPGALPVDFGATVDGIVWIAVVAVPKFNDSKYLATFAEKGLSINVGFVPDEEVQSIERELPDPCAGEAEVVPRIDPCVPSEAGVEGKAREVVWQISTGLLDPKTRQPIYDTLTVTGDTTRGLTQMGVTRLKIPKDLERIGVFDELPDPDLLGTGELPPALEDKKDAENTVFWLRAYHRDESHRFGRVLWIGANAIELQQRKKASLEFLGTGTGQAAQSYRLVNRNVIEGSLAVEVEEQKDKWVRWTPVQGFEASREDDKHYVVDLESGTVVFGNGVRGFAPQIGQRVRATEYRFGGGPEGNVAAKAIDKLVAGSPAGASLANLKVANPLPARGGSAAEKIAAALERLPGELRRHDRAVTIGDFRELALATPGADLGRAECLPLFSPTTGSTQAAGVVTVVVWPREDRKRPNAPMPDRTTLRAVCSWLDRRRLVTTELYVIPPTYVPVAVAIGVHVKPGYGVDAVRSWVELVVRQYLAPLPPFGPAGNGWPLGRPVYAPEIEAAVLQVEGVEYVEPNQVAVAHLGSDGRTWVTEKVTLLPHQLPELSVITVVAGERMDPGADYEAPAAKKKVIPFPIITGEC